MKQTKNPVISTDLGPNFPWKRMADFGTAALEMSTWLSGLESPVFKTGLTHTILNIFANGMLEISVERHVKPKVDALNLWEFIVGVQDRCIDTSPFAANEFRTEIEQLVPNLIQKRLTDISGDDGTEITVRTRNAMANMLEFTLLLNSRRRGGSYEIQVVR